MTIMMADMRYNFLLCFCAHVVFFYSIFDIYFQSPLIEGLDSSGEVPALARRLVLFVGDGLRAQTFYDRTEEIAPHLNEIMKSRGVYGIANTQVPTESRPGHVAIISGFYEDPSAIFTGWKENPIEFDSVFNRSRATFAWGSPDVVKMFSKGAASDRVFVNTFDSYEETFSGEKDSSTRLSWWSLTEFTSLLNQSKENETLRKILHQDKIVFFLHLYGIDQAGHTHKPNSEEYLQNILVADKIVKYTEALISDFYQDNETAFIFTSDHGMTDWGSHGDGSDQETKTPYVFWGSGIKSSGFSGDISQIDISPLMSILIGVPIPANSLGTIPTKCLNQTQTDRRLSIELLKQQVCKQFVARWEMVANHSVPWLFRPFDRTVELISATNDSERITEDISTCFEGLRYYQTYNQSYLLFFVSASMIGWIILLSLTVLRNEIGLNNSPINSNILPPKIYNHTMFMAPIFAAITYILVAQSMPWRYYIYCYLAICIWTVVLNQSVDLYYCRANYGRHSCSKFVTRFVLFVGAAESLVAIFFERRISSLILIYVVVWPLFKLNRKFGTRWRDYPKWLPIRWISATLLLIIFPFMPTIKQRSLNVLIITMNFILGLLMSFVWLDSEILPYLSSYVPPKFTKNIFLEGVAFLLHIFAGINTVIVQKNLFLRKGLHLENQIVTWMIFGISLMWPLCTATASSKKNNQRLRAVFLSVCTLCILFTVGYEPAFTNALCMHLYDWVVVEEYFKSKEKTAQCEFSQDLRIDKRTRSVTFDDFRRAFLFLFFAIFAFFGTGNIASVSSFQPDWVRSFLTTFSPFTMTALILVKLLLPIFAATFAFQVINCKLKVPLTTFLIVLMYCEWMGLHFLFAVKNEGSWLEIGSSVSRFVISQTITAFLLLLYLLAGFYAERRIVFLQCNRSRF